MNESESKSSYIPWIGNLSEIAAAVSNASRILKSSNLWWRGQPEDKPLIPGIFRPGLEDPNLEPRIYVSYSRRVLTRHNRCPGPGQLANWLFFMQHYRLPTRLLDWTESILVATLFAVDESDKHEGDAVVWALDPVRKDVALNPLTTPHCLLSPEALRVGDLALYALVALEYNPRVVTLARYRAGVHRTQVGRLKRGESGVTVETLAGDLGCAGRLVISVLQTFWKGDEAQDSEAAGIKDAGLIAGHLGFGTAS